jgi:Ca2+-dependent lipid-binding protein
MSFLRWLDVGSGKLGRVFLEILAADNLPNKDVGVSANDKTDAFVSIVYEDCAVRTDVVADCLSPRWLPWMQRAFIFRMMHSSR